jgi:hypothetical protein
MTLFEYLAIAFSLVFSFAGMRLIAGLPHAFRSPRRYWIHLTFVFFQLLVTITAFWGFWNFRFVEWTYLSFVFALMLPAVIYHNACVLIPENALEVESWRDHYFSVRKAYFIGICCWIFAVGWVSTFLLDMPFFHWVRGVQAPFLGAAILGVVSANERLHGVLAVFLLVLVVAVATSIGLQPGSLVETLSR